MGKGMFNYANHSLQEITWDEIQRHRSKDDRWIVVDDYIYDISRWAKKHPGGEKIISNWAGQDASVSFSNYKTWH